ncbi:MAG: Uma2 family endonuclease, partial [Oscillospiraceae bacterium]|nr:Uma2 family endonuclease [Oscillospiraceae bacterium]
MTRERARELYKDDYHELKIEFIHERKEYIAPAAIEHNDTADYIKEILRHFIRDNKLPYKLCADSLIVHYDDKHYATPDIAVVSDPSKIIKNSIYYPPELVIEILSESTRDRDLISKKNAYGKFGVPEYWTVNPNEKTVTVWKNEGARLEIEKIYSLPSENYDPEIDEYEYETKFNTPLFGDALTLDLE